MEDKSDSELTAELLHMAEVQENKNEKGDIPGANWHLVRQSWTALGPIMQTIAVGMTFGYSAVLLPQLKATPLASGTDSIIGDDLVVESSDAESWIASSGALLMAPGCWLSGLLMDTFGRKMSHQIASPIFIAGWLLVGLAPNIVTLIVGRLFCGLCVGLQLPLGPVYVAETSEPRLRGILLAGISLAVAVGILISHVLGTWLHWRVAAHLSAVFPALCFICCLFATESPASLIKRNQEESARNAWLYLRGVGSDDEFEAMRSRNASQKGDKDSQGTGKPTLRSSSFLKPLFILNVFFLTSQFSGINVVVFYCVKMIQDVSGPGENGEAYTATLLLDALRVGASALACWLTRNYPRRTLAGISGFGSSASLLGLGLVLFLDVGKPWVPIALLFAYICVVSIGLVPLPWLLCGELFPVAVRGIGSGLTTGFAAICFFVVVKTGPAMFLEVGVPGTFVVYGAVALFGTVFLCFFLPETKDQTLQNIEDRFTDNTKADDKAEQPNEDPV